MSMSYLCIQRINRYADVDTPARPARVPCSQMYHGHELYARARAQYVGSDALASHGTIVRPVCYFNFVDIASHVSSVSRVAGAGTEDAPAIALT
jgi:hypothetical protein